jgi:shikimate dehydrogenase
MKITGKTKITGIFGYPIEHTLSPAMHNTAFKALEIDYCYVPFLVHPDNLATAVNAIKALNIIGVNITIPHKEKVISFLNEISEEALFIGAVNTVVNKEGKLIGYNTDGRGFMKSLEENEINIKNKKVLIIGAGGAARAIGYYICKNATSLTIYGRTRQKADKLADDFRRINSCEIIVINAINELNSFDIIINATPLGLKDDDPLPIKIDNLPENQIVCDLIYKQTNFLKKAQLKGCKTLNGLGMLLWQGALAFKLWTDKEPPIDVMKKALELNIS